MAGGEQRWWSNLADLLRSNGHEVVGNENGWRGEGCDVTCYANDDWCERYVTPVHIHCSYLSGQASWRCGNAWVALPYRKLYQMSGRERDLFIPTPFPDHHLPVDIRPNVEREEVLFAPRYGFTAYPRGVVLHLLECLRWLAQAQEVHPFKVNLMCIDPPDGHFERISCLDEIREIFQGKDMEIHPTLPWDQYIEVVGRCRLSIHPRSTGPLYFPASLPDALGCYVVPVVEGTREFMDSPFQTTPNVENIVRLFQDDDLYSQHHQGWENIFHEHRSESTLTLFNEAMEKVGLNPQT